MACCAWSISPAHDQDGDGHVRHHQTAQFCTLGQSSPLTSGNLLCLRSSTRSFLRLASVSGRLVNTFSDKLRVVKLKEERERER